MALNDGSVKPRDNQQIKDNTESVNPVLSTEGNGTQVKVQTPEHISIFDGLRKYVSIGGGAAVGAFASAVQEMGAWYVANIHDYNQAGYTPCDLLNGKKVRHDCSGFVTACLWKAGFLMNRDHPCSSETFGNSQDVANDMTTAGFNKISFSSPDECQAYDIIVQPSKHVEIYFQKQNGRHKVYAWGSCHDAAHGGLPCGYAPCQYQVIWRPSASILNGGLTGGGFSGELSSLGIPMVIINRIKEMEAGTSGPLDLKHRTCKDIGDGKHTVGYGSTYELNGQPCTLGKVYTQQECDALFAAEMSSCISKIKSEFGSYNLTPMQIGVLVSLKYNFGHVKPAVANAIKGGSGRTEVANIIAHLSDGANPKFRNGLMKRRREEAQWWLS